MFAFIDSFMFFDDPSLEVLDILLKLAILATVVFGTPILWFIISNHRIDKKKQQQFAEMLRAREAAIEELKNRLVQQYVNWHRGVSEVGRIDKIETDILLRDGEECLRVERMVSMYETRSVKGEQEWSLICKGTLYITNKKIFFDGVSHDRKLELDKLVTLKACWSAIAVSVENRQKTVVFEGLNGKICQQIVKCCLGQELGEVSLATDYVPVGCV